MPSSVNELVAISESNHFKSCNTRLVFDYIEEKRGDKGRAAWADVDLTDLDQVTPSMCIRDVVDGGKNLKCRYWGDQFNSIFKVNCTGKLVTEIYPPYGIKNTLALYRRVLRSDKPLRLVGSVGYVNKGIDHMVFEGITVCLDGKDRPKQHILSVLQFDYELDEEDQDFLLKHGGINCVQAKRASL